MGTYNIVHQLGKDVTVNGYRLTKLTGQSFVRRIQQAKSQPPPRKSFWLSRK